ncbi:yeats family-domain-containing protein [Triangularia verruculosa]|uniref:Protein AF-9 homolog n=1 Tax=Triangularia verruculosa TaxID=2587418 RepID=A0AAN7AMZ9_9PEZI|nr:yeats family-domain-containing protein [Triangularia verruculosa]
MADKKTNKRIKSLSIHRPFIYGTTAAPFHPQSNPKPPGIPDDHTHSWTVFVKGVDDTDITYWLRRVQFKLHESIPNHVRVIDAVPGKPFSLSETGWGEFEIAIRLYYVTESNEKPQTLYHHLRLHPYGRTEEEKELMKNGPDGGVVKSWNYDEQIFNEPYESFYEVLTSGVVMMGGGMAATQKGGKGGKQKVERSEGGVLARSAMIPLANRGAEYPFSRETEQCEIEKLKKALVRVEEMTRRTKEEMERKEKRLRELKAEGAKG